MRKKASSVARVTDSGIEDTASYLEPSAICLRESEFHHTDYDVDGSTIEGSVVDTDYADRLAVKTADSGDVRDGSQRRVKSCLESEQQNHKTPRHRSAQSAHL